MHVRLGRWGGLVALLCAIGAVPAATAPAVAAHADPPRLPSGNERCTDASDGLISVGTPRLIAEREIPLCITGSVTWRFRGSPSAGCAARGLCGYRGSVVWTPRGGQLLALRYASGRRRFWTTFVTYDRGGVRMTTARSVGGHLRGRCTDRSSSDSLFLGQTRVRAGRAALTLPRGGTDGWPEHCAGPTQADLPPPTRPQLSLARMLHGVATASVTRTRGFVNDGWAGTVTEHLSVSAGPSKGEGTGTGHPRPGPPQRAVEVTFHAGPMTGSADVTWSRARAGCAAADACGLHGSERLTAPAGPARGAPLHLWAYGPAQRPERDFLTALGVARGGDPNGISVTGIELGENRLGVRAATEQAGTRCHGATRARFTVAAYGSTAPFWLDAASFAPTDPLRTSCPGPALGGRWLTRLRVQPGSLGAAHPALVLDAPRSFREQGFGVSIRPHLRIALSRRRVIDRPGSALPLARRSRLAYLR